MMRQFYQSVLSFRVAVFFLLFVSLFQFSTAQVPDAAQKSHWKAFLKGGTELKIKVSRKDIETAISVAEDYLGTKHCMGGRSKKCIDCSGLVLNALVAIGAKIKGRTAQDIGRYGKIQFNQDKLERGDLVFFTKTYRSDDLITHVGIVLGDGQFIHTSASKGVMISNYIESGYWSSHYIFGTQLR